MTNTDSFISEVSEEVRRDRLFALFRRYGWIGILAVLLAVGAAGFREWSIAQQKSAAESFGDGFRSAVSQSDAGSVLRALEELEAEGGQTALVGLAKAGTLAGTGDTARSLGELAAIAGDEDISQVYRDLAELKSIWIQAGEMTLDEQLERLSALEAPGAPFRLLANETRAHALIRHGRFEDAASVLRGIGEETSVPQDLRARVAQLLATLGTEDTEPGDSE